MSKKDSGILNKESHLKEFILGAKASFPLVIGAIPFGIIFGTLAVKNGLSILATMGMSLFVFAGSAQFIAIGLLAIGTSIPIILVTTFIVNLRHLLYAANLLPHVRQFPHYWRGILAFALTDETFAVVANRIAKDKQVSRWYFFGSVSYMYVNWNICTAIGILIGESIPNIANWGLEVAMPVTFIGMVIPYLKNKPMWAAVLMAGVISLIASPLPHKLGLMMATLAGVSTGIGLELIQRSTSNEPST